MRHTETANVAIIGTTEAARLTGLPVRTFNWRVAQGRIPYVQKLPGRNGAYLFDRAAIEALRDEEKSA